MHMPDKPKKDSEHNIKSLQSLLIKSVYLKLNNLCKCQEDKKLMYLLLLL